MHHTSHPDPARPGRRPPAADEAAGGSGGGDGGIRGTAVTVGAWGRKLTDSPVCHAILMSFRACQLLQRAGMWPAYGMASARWTLCPARTATTGRRNAPREEGFRPRRRPAFGWRPPAAHRYRRPLVLARRVPGDFPAPGCGAGGQRCPRKGARSVIVAGTPAASYAATNR